MCIEDQRPSSKESSASRINPTHSVAKDLYSLLDEVDSESKADEFGIGTHCKKHDFDNHLKVSIFEELIRLTHSMNWPKK